MHLGTNDMKLERCITHYAAAINTLMAALPRDHPVIWVNQRTDIPGAQGKARRVNAALEAARRHWHNLTIANFDTHFRDRPNWFDNQGTNVHLNTTGQTAYARWLHGILDAVP